MEFCTRFRYFRVYRRIIRRDTFSSAAVLFSSAKKCLHTRSVLYVITSARCRNSPFGVSCSVKHLHDLPVDFTKSPLILRRGVSQVEPEPVPSGRHTPVRTPPVMRSYSVDDISRTDDRLPRLAAVAGCRDVPSQKPHLRRGHPTRKRHRKPWRHRLAGFNMRSIALIKESHGSSGEAKKTTPIKKKRRDNCARNRI